MALQSYDDMNDLHMDALREIGNIGSGNAASALADMLATPVNISVPAVRIMEFTEVIEALGGPEEMIVGILLNLEGDIEGMIMFLLHQNFANELLKNLLGVDDALGEMGEMGYSALQEIGNIMAASYVNAIAAMTGLNINISVPSLSVDMLGAILSVPAIYYANISDKMIFIEDEFSNETLTAPNHEPCLMIPDVISLKKIMTNLGLEA